MCKYYIKKAAQQHYNDTDTVVKSYKIELLDRKRATISKNISFCTVMSYPSTFITDCIYCRAPIL